MDEMPRRRLRALRGITGAGDGTRTHDSLLGKQVLYRLSYARLGRPEQSLLCRLDRIIHQLARISTPAIRFDHYPVNW